MNSIYFLGDSVFDCGRYNAERVTPSALLYQNRNDLFPEFKEKDLRSKFSKYQVRDLSIDGATVDDLLQQYRGAFFAPNDIVLISVGGSDFLQGLHHDLDGGEIRSFTDQYGFVLSQIPSKKIIVNVYDPFFGRTDMSPVFSQSLDHKLVRANYDRLNRGIEALASRYGTFLDLRAHFLTGDSSWFAHEIEPSLRGASEIRKVIWGILVKNGLLIESGEIRRNIS